MAHNAKARQRISAAAAAKISKHHRGVASCMYISYGGGVAAARKYQKQSSAQIMALISAYRGGSRAWRERHGV